MQLKSLIRQNTYKIEDIIGKGSFGEVYKGVNNQTNERVAIKVITASKNSQQCESALNQITNLKSVQSDYVVRIEDFFYDSSQSTCNIVMELCEGSLRSLIKGKKTFSQDEIFSFLTQCVTAFLALQEKKIMHLDIKPQNILLADKQKGYYKICDFGCSQKVNTSRLLRYDKDFPGTANYMAPQIYISDRKQKTRTSADIWSLGVTLYEMVFKALPFTTHLNGQFEQVDQNIIQDYLQGKFQINYTSTANNGNVISIIKKMLIPNPVDRITWLQLKKILKIERQIPQYMFYNIDLISLNVQNQIQKIQKILSTIEKKTCSRSSPYFWRICKLSLCIIITKTSKFFYEQIHQFVQCNSHRWNLINQQRKEKIIKCIRDFQEIENNALAKDSLIRIQGNNLHERVFIIQNKIKSNQRYLCKYPYLILFLQQLQKTILAKIEIFIDKNKSLYYNQVYELLMADQQL